MLRFFFNRNGWFVLALESIGVLGFFMLALSGRWSAILTIYLASYLFIRFSAVWNWYENKLDLKGNDAGIGLHFKKMLVAAAYVIAFTNIFVLAGFNWPVYLSIGLLLFIIHIHIILLYFHFKDRDTTPPNFFSFKDGLK